MKYDFTTVIDRTGKDALALDMIGKGNISAPEEGFDPIPMWIADMNFPCCPTIQEAVIERTKHPLFGYFIPSDDYYDSIIRWQNKRNGVESLKKEHIGYENGVLGGVTSALKAFACPGDAVLVHSPTYIGFTNILTANGFKIVHSPLKKDENGVWRMDYEDMDRKLKEYNIHVAIFCNPHNPCGRVWEKQEMEKALEVYRNNQVQVISDEIWSDLILSGKHIPLQQVNSYAHDSIIAFYAPSKTFNLAGLIGSYHIIYDKYLRDRVEAVSSKTHYNDMNVLSMHALIGAYKKEGEEWLEELLTVLRDNADFACDFISGNFKGVKVFKPQGTYMLFLDCEEWCRENKKNIGELIEAGQKAGVIWQDGRAFNGEYSIRMNLAHPTFRVKEAFQRLKKYVFVTA